MLHCGQGKCRGCARAAILAQLKVRSWILPSSSAEPFKGGRLRCCGSFKVLAAVEEPPLSVDIEDCRLTVVSSFRRLPRERNADRSRRSGGGKMATHLHYEYSASNILMASVSPQLRLVRQKRRAHAVPQREAEYSGTI